MSLSNLILWMLIGMAVLGAPAADASTVQDPSASPAFRAAPAAGATAGDVQDCEREAGQLPRALKAVRWHWTPFLGTAAVQPISTHAAVSLPPARAIPAYALHAAGPRPARAPPLG